MRDMRNRKMDDFDVNKFSQDTVSRNLRNTANSNANLNAPGVALSVGVAEPRKGTEHHAFLVRDWKGVNGGDLPTNGDRSKVASKPGERHLNRTGFRAGVDGRPAALADADTSDKVGAGEMYNPVSTIFKLLRDQDDHGNYKSDGKGSPHAKMPKSDAYVETGKVPKLDDGEDETAGHLTRCCESLTRAAEAVDNRDAREAYLDQGCSHLEAAFKAHRRRPQN
jgi:hypothetical protein